MMDENIAVTKPKRGGSKAKGRGGRPKKSEPVVVEEEPHFGLGFGGEATVSEKSSKKSAQKSDKSSEAIVEVQKPKRGRPRKIKE